MQQGCKSLDSQIEPRSSQSCYSLNIVTGIETNLFTVILFWLLHAQKVANITSFFYTLGILSKYLIKFEYFHLQQTCLKTVTTIHPLQSKLKINNHIVLGCQQQHVSKNLKAAYCCCLMGTKKTLSHSALLEAISPVGEKACYSKDPFLFK